MNPLRTSTDHKLHIAGKLPRLLKEKISVPFPGAMPEKRCNAGLQFQLSIGVTSTATSGPTLDPPPVRLRPIAGPSSITAISLSLSFLFSTPGDCAKAFPEHRNKDAKTRNFVAFTTTSFQLARSILTFRFATQWIAKLYKREQERLGPQLQNKLTLAVWTGIRLR